MAEGDSYIQDLVGRRLGPYEIRTKLGEGGMGAVYKAYDPSLEREVAVKILPPEFARDRSYIQRFEREARALARLRHPNLVHIYAVGQEDGIHYFAMEFIEGETLSDYLRRRGRLPQEEALRLASQVLSALHAIHRLGITHRDIKASNIMIDRDGRAVLMDFGLMKDRSQEGLTTVGAVLGTPEYMSPEQAEGAEVTPLSDIYSFGVLIYEMLAGRLPFLGTSVIAVLKAHLEEPPPNLAKIRPDIPAGLVRIVHRALAKKPQDRYPSLAYMARDLIEIYQDPGLKDIAGDASGARTLRLRRPLAAGRKVEMAALGLGVLVLVVAVFVLLSTLGGGGNGGNRPPAPAPPPGPPAATTATRPEPAPPPVSRPVVSVRLADGREFRGRLKELRRLPAGPAWVLETDDGGEQVVFLEPGMEISYPGR